MTKPSMLLILPLCLVFAACGATEPSNTSDVAEDFSARINGGQGSQSQTPRPTADEAADTPVAAPTVAQALPQAAEGAFTPGTATDPNSATCAANVMGPFIGKQADDATRAAILTAAAGASEVRFIPHGSPFVRPDPTNPRLNLMLDNLGIIRDARCG